MSDSNNLKSNGFTVFDNIIFKLDLSHTEFRVLMYVIKWANADKPLALDIIATDTQMSRSSVQRALQSLIKDGHILATKPSSRGIPNKYIPHSNLLVKGKSDVK